MYVADGWIQVLNTCTSVCTVTVEVALLPGMRTLTSRAHNPNHRQISRGKSGIAQGDSQLDRHLHRMLISAKTQHCCNPPAQSAFPCWRHSGQRFKTPCAGDQKPGSPLQTALYTTMVLIKVLRVKFISSHMTVAPTRLQALFAIYSGGEFSVVDL